MAQDPTLRAQRGPRPLPTLAGEAQDSGSEIENKATGIISHAGEYVGKQTLSKTAARRVIQPSLSGW